MNRKTGNYLVTCSYSYLLVCILTLMSMPTSHAQKSPKSNPETWITVYVHGIMSIQHHVNLGNFVRFFKDEVEDTLYAKTVELMRQDPIFYQNQAMQGLGLQIIEPDVVKKGNSSGALALLANEIEKHCGITHNNHYYTFGWSGLLSAKQRYKDARLLFSALENKVKEFKAQGINPKIRLLGYSHGGNIILNLGAIHQKERPESRLAIDETIFIGVPVQEETDYLVNDPVFKKIYHFFSRKDRVQALDFFSKGRASFKNFKQRKGFKLPQKLTQIKIKVIRCTKNIRSQHRRYKLTLDFNKPSIISGRSHLLRNVSPGHAELWFFGWTPVHYRNTYPLYPLPTIAVTSIILNAITDIVDTIPPTSIITADLRPQHGVMLIKQKEPRKSHKVVQFISDSNIDEFADMAQKYAPGIYNRTIYREHLNGALKRATKLFNQEQIEKKCKNSNHPSVKKYCKKWRSKQG